MQEAETLPVRLARGWHETIQRDEAIRRLRTQNLPAERHREIEAEIPLRTEHYLTFDDRVFREYVQLGDDPAILLLMLGGVARGETFVTALPMLGGRRQYKRHDFHEAQGVLHENRVAKPMFRRLEEPVELRLDVSFVRPGAMMRCPCRICYWVHSVLDIHEIDWLCCLGACGGPIS